MIVEFSVKNFRSIKELQTISFVATGLKSPEEYLEVDTNNISNEDDYRLLKTIGIYGANASGKSNIIRALEYFLRSIKNEPSSQSNLENLCDPFLFQESAQKTESFFQIVLFIKNKKYRYGFTVKKNLNLKTNPDEIASKEIIVGEWLYGVKEKNMVEIFKRKGNQITKDLVSNTDKIPKIPYDHTLFLTHAAAFDSQGDCAVIRQYISGWTISNLLMGFDTFRRNTIRLMEEENRKKDLISLLNTFNLKYDDIIIEREQNSNNVSNISLEKIFMIKSFQIGQDSHSIRLNLKNNESAGTQKLFEIVGLLLRAFNMKYSAFIILDELDSNFHPSLLIKLIKLFNNPDLNHSNCQLLFTSHDTNLMSPSIMRRDQFYFTEKGEDDSTRLYSLADLKGIRNDADFAKQYLAGMYGGLPILSNYENESNKN